MLRQLTKRACTAAAGVALVYGLWAMPANAQSAAPVVLPTAPGADRSVDGGLSMAHASLPGGPNRSPLEPYLVTWLLPISGLLAVFAGIYADRQTQGKAKQTQVSTARVSKTTRRSA